MESTSLLIEHVLSGPAKVAGVRKGDRILRVNGHRIHDELDYRFFGSGEWNEVDVERPETGEEETPRVAQQWARLRAMEADGMC
jgi:S1-C subfamily serine protease